MTNAEIVQYMKDRHPSFTVEDDGQRVTMSVERDGKRYHAAVRRDGEPIADELRVDSLHQAALAWDRKSAAA